MTNDFTLDKVCIYVYVSLPAQKSDILNEVLWGIEEEGIPVYVRESKHKTAQVQSYHAALASALGVGVGFGKDNMISLHSSKLEQDKPLLTVGCDEALYNMRNIGANAARLVKGIPFKLEKNG
ncbi:glycerol dehydratase reactivase beta/small subunit family protein [Alkalibacterium sp. f15]|uniref:glycerol dehydratase reactivase beta/small subunit family protein n=1 Tax=Alkalibacterium sp. f15 TaxID=3414029 RepID=UPI003BF7F5D7